MGVAQLREANRSLQQELEGLRSELTDERLHRYRSEVPANTATRIHTKSSRGSSAIEGGSLRVKPIEGVWGVEGTLQASSPQDAHHPQSENTHTAAPLPTTGCSSFICSRGGPHIKWHRQASG